MDSLAHTYTHTHTHTHTHTQIHKHSAQLECQPSYQTISVCFILDLERI